MLRRAFCFHLADLTAVGASQVEAYRELFLKNTEHIRASQDIIRVVDITFGFNGTPCDAMATVKFFDGETCLLAVPLHVRATYWWVGAPETPMLSTEDRFRWTIECTHTGYFPELEGMVIYLNSDGKVRYHKMQGSNRYATAGRLREPVVQPVIEEPKPKRAMVLGNEVVA